MQWSKRCDSVLLHRHRPSPNWKILKVFPFGTMYHFGTILKFDADNKYILIQILKMISRVLKNYLNICITFPPPPTNLLHDSFPLPPSSISPNYIPSLGPAFGWLLCLSIHWKPSKVKALLLSLFLYLYHSIRPPKQQENILPHVLRLAVSPLQRPPTPPTPSFCSQCCVKPTSGGHQRVVLRPSLNFLMGAILAPQTRGSDEANTNLGAGHLYQTHREPWRRNSGPWQMLPWRGRGKPLGVGWQRLSYVCVFLSVDTWWF
jgi:hypothetical protein